MKTLEGNKIIAEFMGAEITHPYSVVEEDGQDGLHFTYPPHYKHEIGNSRHHSSSGLKYHSSWDWLMPVVEKISKMDWRDFNKVNLVELVNKKDDVLSLPINSPINEVYYHVVQFIQWYNENKDK